jgi:hypothetical protein
MAFSVYTVLRLFLRELFKTIELFRFGQARSHCAESQRSTCFRLAQNSPKPLGLAGNNLRGLAMACSSRGPRNGVSSGATQRSQTTQRTSFLSSLLGRPYNRPPGSSTAHLQLFKSNMSYSVLQVAPNSTNPARCLVATDSEYLPVGFRATLLLWEKAGFCGKYELWGVKCRRISDVLRQKQLQKRPFSPEARTFEPKNGAFTAQSRRQRGRFVRKVCPFCAKMARPGRFLSGRGCLLVTLTTKFCRWVPIFGNSAKGPVSRILSCAVIPLGAALPRTLISDLPGGFGNCIEPP